MMKFHRTVGPVSNTFTISHINVFVYICKCSCVCICETWLSLPWFKVGYRIYYLKHINQATPQPLTIVDVRYWTMCIRSIGGKKKPLPFSKNQFVQRYLSAHMYLRHCSLLFSFCSVMRRTQRRRAWISEPMMFWKQMLSGAPPILDFSSPVLPSLDSRVCGRVFQWKWTFRLN